MTKNQILYLETCRYCYGEFYSYLSANNPLTVTEIEYEGNEQQYEDIESYTYMYNSNGFPTTITNDGDDTVFTYECE